MNIQLSIPYTVNGVSLRKVQCSLEYYSSTFSIVVELNKRLDLYEIAIHDEVRQTLIELVVDIKPHEVFTAIEQLKTKYILDYDRSLYINW